MTTATKKPITRKSATRRPATRKPATRSNGAAPAVARAPAAGPAKWPDYPGEVKFGDKGPKHLAAVKTWQWALRQRVRPDLPMDGNYGTNTLYCCNWWQDKHPHGRPIMDRAYPHGFMGLHMWHSLAKNL